MTPEFSTRHNLKFTHFRGGDVLPVLEYQTRGSQMKNMDEHFMVYMAEKGSGDCNQFYDSGGSIARTAI